MSMSVNKITRAQRLNALPPYVFARLDELKARAREQGIDLILMGVSYKRRFGQFSLGNVVPYVLKNAPCRVILYHQIPQQQLV